MSHSTARLIKEHDFITLKKEIENELVILEVDPNRYEISSERNEFLFHLVLDEVSDRLLIDVLVCAKKHIENWRIHTFENGYLSLQALNESIFNVENLMANVKVRISGLYGEKIFELQKKSNLTQTELSLLLALLRIIHKKKSYKNPLEELVNNGCSVYLPDANKNNFDEFGGYENIKEEVYRSVIDPLIKPEIYDKIARQTRVRFEENRPRAVLFTGPPGVGKTTMARLIASNSNIPLIYIPLENIMSAYYGESSKRLARIFEIAAESEYQQLIIFLDEIDSLAPSRNEKLFEATRRMLSVLLRKIDGLENSRNYMTIGATNRKQDLDEALLSRFDTVIEFPLPSTKDRVGILRLFAKHLSSEDLENLAEKLLGFSARSIKDICQKAERIKAREIISQDEVELSLPHFEHYVKAILLTGE